MKTKISKLVLMLSALILAMASCQSGSSPAENTNETTSKLNPELEKLEQFLGIPVFPNSEIASFYTFDRSDEDEIPDQLKDASVSLIIDAYDKVPLFYEAKLDSKFTVDTDSGKKYYTLVYTKDGWQYEIFVGQDTYMNKPIFSITVLKIDE